MNYEPQQHILVRLLKEKGSLSIKEFMDLTGFKRHSIRGRLSELKKQGLITKAFNDKFTLVIKPQGKLI